MIEVQRLDTAAADFDTRLAALLDGHERDLQEELLRGAPPLGPGAASTRGAVRVEPDVGLIVSP